MRKTRGFLLAAGALLAMVFTLSCGEHDTDIGVGDDGVNEKFSYCVFSGEQRCFDGPYTSSDCNSSGGIPSNSCPYGGGGSSPSVTPSSSGGSSSSVVGLSSSSVGGGDPDPSDGGPTNWTAVSNSTFEASNIRALAYGNNIWVAGGGGNDRNTPGKIAVSADGITWTAVSQTIFGNNQRINAIAFANGMFVAVGAKIATSTDGTNWTEASAPFGVSDIAYGGGRWVVTSEDGTTAYSTDGRSWTAISAENIFGTSNNDIFAVVYGNNKFIIGGSWGIMATSSNGASWIKVESPPFRAQGLSSHRNIYGIAYSGSRFVTVGNYGNIATSLDGTSWTVVPALNTTFNTTLIYAVAYGNNRFVAGGEGGKIAYSANGETWTSVVSTFGTNNILAIAYGNGRFVAVGSEGKIAYADWGSSVGGGGSSSSGIGGGGSSSSGGGGGGTYNIGDTGPGGGIIFYYSAEGFAMADDGLISHYLEAAPANTGGSIAWASSGYTGSNIAGTTRVIGAGRKNTALILATDANAPAAKACSDYSNNGFSDWFLPSDYELDELYNNRTAVGNLGTSIYWSSSQDDNNYSFITSFTGANPYIAMKNDTHFVRPIRAF